MRCNTLGLCAHRLEQLYPIDRVPLGVGIANDVFQGCVKSSPASVQRNGRDNSGPKLSGPPGTVVGAKGDQGQNQKALEQRGGDPGGSASNDTTSDGTRGGRN